MERQLSKELRLLGIERKDAADKIGVTEATLSNWIRGVYPISPVGVRILKEMGIPKKAIRDPSKEV